MKEHCSNTQAQKYVNQEDTADSYNAASMVAEKLRIEIKLNIEHSAT